MLLIWSNWAEWMSTRLAPNSHHKWIATSDRPIQHVRSKSLQKTYPRESRNHLLLFFRKVLDTYYNIGFPNITIIVKKENNFECIILSYISFFYVSYIRFIITANRFKKLFPVTFKIVIWQILISWHGDDIFLQLNVFSFLHRKNFIVTLSKKDNLRFLERICIDSWGSS